MLPNTGSDSLLIKRSWSHLHGKRICCHTFMGNKKFLAHLEENTFQEVFAHFNVFEAHTCFWSIFLTGVPKWLSHVQPEHKDFENMSFIIFLFRILKSQYLLGMYLQLVILWSRHHPAQDANLNHKNYSRGWNYRHFCDLFRFFQGPLLFIICRIFLYNSCAMTWCWNN